MKQNEKKKEEKRKERKEEWKKEKSEAILKICFPVRTKSKKNLSAFFLFEIFIWFIRNHRIYSNIGKYLNVAWWKTAQRQQTHLHRSDCFFFHSFFAVQMLTG